MALLEDRRRMVGDRLAELREQKALTLHDLEDLSGVGADGISKIENGHRKPRPSTLRKLARALGVEVEDFFQEPAVPLAEAPREAGLPEEARTVRDIAHAEARREEARDRKANRRTLASEGLDRATRISDVYDPGVYDVLSRQPSDELAGGLLDAERDYVHAEQECAVLEQDNAGLRNLLRERDHKIARLEEELAQLRKEHKRVEAEKA